MFDFVPQSQNLKFNDLTLFKFSEKKNYTEIYVNWFKSLSKYIILTVQKLQYNSNLWNKKVWS